MTEILKTSHYNNKINIKFYPNSHRYQIDGNKDYLISVTAATGMIDKSRPLLIWASRLSEEYLKKLLTDGKYIDEQDIKSAVKQYKEKKEEAATIGASVHDWAEQYIEDLNPELQDDEKVNNGILAFIKWVNENDIKFLFSEKFVYSRQYDYVGIMDTGFTMGKDDHKIKYPGDFKTSSGIYMEMPIQLSAYQHAESEEHGTEWGDKCIIRFDKETGNFETKWFPKEDHERHFKAFLACLELKRQNKEWEKLHGFYSKK